MTHLRRAIVLLFFSCCIAPLAMAQLTLKVKIQSYAHGAPTALRQAQRARRNAPHPIRLGRIRIRLPRSLRRRRPCHDPLRPSQPPAPRLQKFSTPRHRNSSPSPATAAAHPDAAANATAKEIIKRIRKLRGL